MCSDWTDVTAEQIEKMTNQDAKRQLVATCGSIEQAVEFCNRNGFEPMLAASECGYESESGKRTREAMEASFEPCTVNGVLYPTEEKASRVRAVLAYAGIAWHYPGTPQAKAALQAAGLE